MYQDFINQMFIDDPNNEDRGGDFKLHPSAISTCERNAIYIARGETPTNERDVRFTRIMGTGTDYHIKLQTYLQERFPDALMEYKVEWGPIKGHADILMPIGDVADDLDEGLEPVYELADFKTISPNGKRYIQGTKKKLLKSGKWNKHREAAPKPEHVKQVRIYYLGLQRMGVKLTDLLRIVYIDRDDWSTVEFEVEPWTEEEGEAYLENMAVLEAHLFDGTLPDKEPDDYWLCDLCAFRTLCKGDVYPDDSND